MAATGPPPGLGPRAPPASSLPPNPFSNSSQTASATRQDPSSAPERPDATASSRTRPSSCPRMYDRGALLAYSSSPLVRKPEAMAPLRVWFGEWEPYHHKSTPFQYRDSPRRNMDDSSAASPGPAASDVEQAENGAHGGGLIGGALGGFGPKREGGARFGRRQEDKGEGGLRLGALPSRNFPPSGKNPFGQISASGTFRPAGSVGGAGGREREPRGPREGGPDSPGEFRRFPLSERSTSFGKERNRDRDAPPHLAGTGEERPRSGLRERFGEGERSGSGGFRDRRRAGGIEGEDDEDVGESIESPRVRKTGGADLASDWRKPSDKDRFSAQRTSGYSNGAGDRTRGSDKADRFARERGGKGAPSWMGNGDATDSPAWMDEETSSLLATPSKSGNFGAFGRRREADVEPSRAKDDSAGAVDSIQAFKAQMKERERLERERSSGGGSTGGGGSNPPGLNRLDEYDFKGNKDSREEVTDAPAAPSTQITTGESGRVESATSSGPPPGLYDTISNSHGSSASTEAPPGLPGRSSRFARFFDGRPGGMRDPQAAALAAQQKLLESRGDLMSSSSNADRPPSAAAKDREGSAPATESTSTQGGPASASGINIAELFKQASSKDSGSKGGEGKNSGANPSEADVQSMQKLMAMLQAGGGSGNGSQSGGRRSSDGRDTATPVNAHAPRPDSVDRMRELLGGNAAASSPGSQTGPQQRNDLSVDDERHGSTPNITSPQPPHGYGFPPPGISPAMHHAQQHSQQPKSDSGSDQRGQHSRVVSTSGPQQQPHRSQSPSVQGSTSPYNDHAGIHRGQQQQQPIPGFPGPNGGRLGDLGPYGYPSPGAGPGNALGRPPFGMDPRMMGRPPMGAPGLGSPGPGQLPPHIAAALGFGRGPVPPPGLASPPPPPPPGSMGGPRGGPPMSGSFPPNFPPPFGGRPPPPGMPPQMYQQLMSLPPHLQQQLLSGGGLPGLGPMPGQGGPRSPYDMPMQPQPQQQQQQQQGGNGGQMPTSQQPHGGLSSPPPPNGLPPVGSQAVNGANLMALLSGAHRGPSGN